MVRINARTSFGTVGRPGFPFRTFQAQNRRKPLRCQPMTVETLTMKTRDCQSFQAALSQAHSNRSAAVSFDRLTEALQNAHLMAECEDLELQRRTAPEGSEERGQKSGQ
jgi:hypothetical protein